VFSACLVGAEMCIRTRDEGYGHSWKHHAYVPLAEVMVRSVGKPLMYVVHLDDLAAWS